MKLLRVSVLAVLSTTWFGCKENNQGEKDGNLLADTAAYVLQIDGDTAAYSAELLFKSDDPKATAESKDVTKIVFSFPKFTQSNWALQVRDSINNTIQQVLLLNAAGDLAYQSLDERMTDFIAQYEEDKEMTAGMGWGVDNKWLCDVNIGVLANTPRLISLQVTELNFTGGAHGNTQTRYLNFDAKTGKQLSLQDLFTVDLEQLLPVAERHFRRKAQIPDNVPITETEYEFLSGHFELPQNVGISRRSLIFQFDAYELGTNNTFVFEVPLRDIAPLLNKKIMY